MKIALVQCNLHIGNFTANEQKIADYIGQAKASGADLVVFPELSVCGYPPADFLEFDSFVKQCHETALRLAWKCRGIAAIVGLPVENMAPEGKNLYNAACLLFEGAIAATARKSLLPNYDIFDEYRYFEPNTVFNVIPFRGERIALTICEDLWDVGDDLMYTRWPMMELRRQKPTLMINIAASPFHHGQAVIRENVLRENAERFHLPLLYVNQVGAQTELIFDGGSLAMNARGEVVLRLPAFEEGIALIDTKAIAGMEELRGVPPVKMEACHKALVTGIRDYFAKTGIRDAILGLSGGIDSAVVLALAAEALGPDHVSALMLPSRYSSDHSISDSLALATKLGVRCDEIPIEQCFSAFEQTLAEKFGGLPKDITEENLQARCRAVILMACSNKLGPMLLNTSNKSEAAVGYGTLYGDMCGGLSVIGDLYKTEVYELARYINRNDEIIPENILQKAPSAELRPDQKDEDSLPPYSVLDPILFQYIEMHKGPEEIIAMGYPRDTVLRVLKLVNSNEHKRRQAPPVLRVSSKAFGYGRRMPVVGKYLC